MPQPAFQIKSNQMYLLKTHTHTHTHTQPFNGLLSGTTRVGRYQKKHSPTHTHPDHRTSFIIFHQWHPLCSFYVLDSPLVQPLSRSSLVFLLVLDLQLHTPYISSPNHHLLFTAHAHTNAACLNGICSKHITFKCTPSRSGVYPLSWIIVYLDYSLSEWYMNCG